jgi:hypothetical protein
MPYPPETAVVDPFQELVTMSGVESLALQLVMPAVPVFERTRLAI